MAWREVHEESADERECSIAYCDVEQDSPGSVFDQGDADQSARYSVGCKIELCPGERHTTILIWYDLRDACIWSAMVIRRAL